MNKFIDVIFEITDFQSAVTGLAIIDTNHSILEWKNDTPRPIFNLYWRVVTQAPNVPMWNVRFSIEDYLKIKQANIIGFSILAAVYPHDDVETLLANKQLNLFDWEIDDRGELVQVQIDLSANDPRQLPTLISCLRYRELFPAVIIIKDEQDNDVLIKQDRFSRHGQ